MPQITLVDGKVLQFKTPVSVQAVAESIGPGLARAALAGMVDGQAVDTSFVLEKDATLRIITDKDTEGLEVIRHSCAHLFAQALKALFPQAQISIGPVIEDGFYYDFDVDHAFSEADFAKIEEKMAELAAKDLVVSRKMLSRTEAIDLFKSMGESYKVQIIQDLPEDASLSFYQQGDFIDLCRGPHVPSTGKIKVFKLLKVAGAYWRGDSKNKMLQRIYGTAWAHKKDLQDYLTRIEEAEKRDHRKLAKKFDWFHFQEEAPGMVFWHPKGWSIYQALEQYIRSILNRNGYQEVKTPQLLDRSLWEQSGHWEKFREHMFTSEIDGRDYALKPMNCPGHIQIFNQGLKSYRDLPLRMAEFGCCHRYEPSGSLHGLMRVRNFNQDDAHIFCTEDQILSEVLAFNTLLFKIYAQFGFEDVRIRLATRPDLRVGSDAVWDQAEAALSHALEQSGMPWELAPGEGAFYGPKLEYHCRDSLNRSWQCGTMQVDFSMPERLGAYYIAADGSKRAPVMLHRALLGTLERFIGILIEHTAGNLPLWLAPVQAVILNITDAQADYARKIAEDLKDRGLRIALDLRNEKIGFKIREHTIQRVPYLLVVGDRELDQQMLAVRTREGVDRGSKSLSAFVAELHAEMKAFGIGF
ncbi:MAG: threonine--tRNA ligase [Gammaproteobacteria bacterium]|nr:threonine--tRNA ligase [Gammaproteobacteria bacterium]MBP9729185.1 threonine--tRNA ligase [Gammaproteobacteria bacterium]